MYTKPQKEFIEDAIYDSWEPAAAERGYDIFDFDGTGLLEIERNMRISLLSIALYGA